MWHADFWICKKSHSLQLTKHTFGGPTIPNRYVDDILEAWKSFQKTVSMIYSSFTLLDILSFNHLLLSRKIYIFSHLQSFKSSLTKKVLVLKRCSAGALFYSISWYLWVSCSHQIINVYNKLNSAARQSAFAV